MESKTAKTSRATRTLRTVFDVTDGCFDGAHRHVRVVFQAGGRHYVADWVESARDRMGPELMVFRSDRDGNVRNYRNLATWRGVGAGEVRRCVEEFAATVEKGE